MRPKHFRMPLQAMLLISFMVLLSRGVQADPVTMPVINGSDAPDSYPWMVALLRAGTEDSTEAHFCGGALIDSQYVLTAAHCVSGVPPEELQVMIGETELPFSTGVRHKVLGVIVHPNADFYTLENDVALLKLEKPVANAPVAVLKPGDEALVAEGAPAKVLGWGTTDPRLPLFPVNLQEVDMPVHDDALCLKTNGRYFKGNSMLCAGMLSSSATNVDGTDSCYGDSGVPLVVPVSGGFALAGTVSWGLDFCASNKTYGVYSDAIALSSFISTRPDAPPFVKNYPSITGNAVAGSPLTCAGAVFGGEAATSTEYRWRAYSFLNNVDRVIVGANSATFVPSTAEVDSDVSCEIEAKNSGGSAVAYSSNSVYIGPPPVPSPEPTIETSDTSAPSLTLQSIDCASDECHVRVVASDDGGAENVARVDGELTKSLNLCHGSGESCIKTSSTHLEAKSLGEGVWQFALHRPRRGRAKVKILAWAEDTGANRALKPLRIAFKMKKRGA